MAIRGGISKINFHLICQLWVTNRSSPLSYLPAGGGEEEEEEVEDGEDDTPFTADFADSGLNLVSLFQKLTKDTFFSVSLSRLELSDTKVYERQMRALLGTAAHFCKKLVLRIAKCVTSLPPRMSRPLSVGLVGFGESVLFARISARDCGWNPSQKSAVSCERGNPT